MSNLFYPTPFKENSLKKYIFHLLLLLFITFHCGDLDRDNVLDPKNPNSRTKRVILTEIFVNENTGYEFCNTALKAIEELNDSENFRNKILILEYHIEKNELIDSYSLTQCYDRYVNYEPLQSKRGIPDAFFNGKIERVQGASVEKVKDRYESVLKELINIKSYFRIEAKKSIEGHSLDLDVKVVRLGTKEKENLNLLVVLYEDIGTIAHCYVVRKIFPPQIIDSIRPGQVKTFIFSGYLSDIKNMSDIYAVVFVQDQNETTMEVYQAAQF